MSNATGMDRREFVKILGGGIVVLVSLPLTAVLEGRDTHLNVFDADRTMQACIGADRSAGRDGRRVRLPLVRSQ